MNNSNIQVNQGEQLSFSQLFAKRHWKIEIPIIQRDYAQGRDSAKSVRNNFLDSLLDHLQNNKNIDLDFVYGSIIGESNNLFIPLDGQQRLTTLFLLHWYLAAHDDKVEDFRSFITTGEKSNFTYETRTSAHEFCNELVNAEINLSALLKESLSKTIMDKAWYYATWGNDPTIKAMLNMLDAIHEKFRNTSGLYERLTHNESPVITFQFLNLKKFSLTDDLYIKMNSRGKQLTDFENFKAKFEQLIKYSNLKGTYKLFLGTIEEEVKAHEYFAHKIDTIWANLFWNYRNENIDDNYFDDEIMNFIRLVITNHYAVFGQGAEKVANIQMLIGRDNNDNNLTYLQYKELNCLDEKLISDLINIFDLLANGDKTIKTYLEDSNYYNEAEVFKLSLGNKTGYRDKLRFYALYKYLIIFKTTEGLSSWMRVIYNLTDNFIYNRPDEYIRSIQSINELLPKSNNILGELQDQKNKIGGFPEVQVREERIKAYLIEKDVKWEDAILKIERHGYFTGQIGFILNFSGIEAFFQSNQDCNWSANEDSVYFKKFQFYSQCAKAIFNAEGLHFFHDFLWERALLSKGDYLLNKGSNWSFLIDDERDISWKRLLRDSNEGRRDFIKEVFDDKNFNTKNLEEGLQNIINNFAESDWRYHFIQQKEIIEYLGFYKFIRWESENEIFLIKKQRLSGEHAEYFSYAFYIDFLKGKPKYLSPFKETYYHPISGNEELPCVVINDWTFKNVTYAIDVRFISEIDQYEVRFFGRENSSIDNKIKAVLPKEYTANTKYADDSYLYFNSDEEQVIQSIQNLCKALKAL